MRLITWSVPVRMRAAGSCIFAAPIPRVCSCSTIRTVNSMAAGRPGFACTGRRLRPVAPSNEALQATCGRAPEQHPHSSAARA